MDNAARVAQCVRPSERQINVHMGDFAMCVLKDAVARLFVNMVVDVTGVGRKSAVVPALNYVSMVAIRPGVMKGNVKADKFVSIIVYASLAGSVTLQAHFGAV